MFRWTAAGVVALAALGCSDLSLDAPPELIHARFDPDAKVIPMPTDILRDADLARLDIPLDDDEDITPAERELFTFMNTLDGWSTASSATVEFTAPINMATVTAENLQVWQWRATPTLIVDARITIDTDEKKLTIDPPRTGWERGGTYFIMLRGGEAGVEGKRGELLVCDAAFYFLRLTQQLDVPEHERAYPGSTREERQENAGDLEKIRSELARYFTFFEGRGVERTEVAALWSFTITERTELAMDKASQRMPLPINLLIDPDTKRVDLPLADWDTAVEREAKVRLGEYDGFGTSANPMFGFTGPIDADTVNSDTVHLYRVSDTPERVPAKITIMEDMTHVMVEPEGVLEERTQYAVVVTDAVRDAEGKPIIVMPLGHLLKSSSTVYADGASTVGMVEDADARKLELIRGEVTDLLGNLDRSDVLTAWTFTTMSIETPLADYMAQPELLNVRADPKNVERSSPGAAVADFALGITSIFNVGDVYNGTIQSPVFLDPLTRGWRTDGSHEVQEIPFTMTVPRNLDPNTPVPVVIFGHGVMSERRFVLAVADALAARGYAAIAIDFPYHGDRTYCWSEGPLSVPNPQTGEITGIEPCQAGYTCHEDGKCKDSSGQGNGLAAWPVIGMYQASGAAYIEVEKIANTRDHFRQTLVDLSALSRSLRKGDWRSVIGAPLKTDKLYFAGMSLGSIIGASFIAFSPEIERAVLNVPGSDTVDMFDASPFFSGQVDAFFVREGVDRASYDGQRFLNVARWLMDSTDPQSFWHRVGARDALIQMATLDFIIPNEFTLKLANEAGIPRRDYIGEHAFIVIPVEPAYLRGVNDMANFIEGSLQP